MIYFDLVKSVGCNMFCCLLQITDSRCIRIPADHFIQCLRKDLTFFLSHAHPFQYLRSANFEKMIFFSSSV